MGSGRGSHRMQEGSGRTEGVMEGVSGSKRGSWGPGFKRGLGFRGPEWVRRSRWGLGIWEGTGIQKGTWGSRRDVGSSGVYKGLRDLGGEGIWG